MTTLSRLPSGVSVMLDANIVVYALFPQTKQHPSCKQLFERGARGDIQLHIAVNTVADVIHRTMIFEILTQGIAQQSGDAVNYLKQHPQAVQQLTRYKAILRDLRPARINILPLSYHDLHSSRQHREDYGLMTNDSLIVAVMKREKIHHLATNDSDFRRAPGIVVYVPD